MTKAERRELAILRAELAIAEALLALPTREQQERVVRAVDALWGPMRPSPSA